MKIFSFIFIFIFSSSVFAQDLIVSNFIVNCFEYDSANTNFNKGLRIMGIGEFFFNKKAYAKAIPYYQEALTMIPDNSAIAFRLGEIYQKEKLWKLSTLYYQEAIYLMQKPVNFSKSQLLSYIARIRIAQIAYQSQKFEESKKLVEELRLEESVMKSLYPQAWEEFTVFFDKIYPSSAVRTEISNSKRSIK